MPNYDYKCLKCQARQEINHPMGARPENLCCENCGGRLARVFGQVFFSRNCSASSDSRSLAPAGGHSCPSCSGGSCSTCSS